MMLCFCSSGSETLSRREPYAMLVGCFRDLDYQRSYGQQLQTYFNWVLCEGRLSPGKSVTNKRWEEEEVFIVGIKEKFLGAYWLTTLMRPYAFSTFAVRNVTNCCHHNPKLLMNDPMVHNRPKIMLGNWWRRIGRRWNKCNGLYMKAFSRLANFVYYTIYKSLLIFSRCLRTMEEKDDAERTKNWKLYILFVSMCSSF